MRVGHAWGSNTWQLQCNHKMWYTMWIAWTCTSTNGTRYLVLKKLFVMTRNDSTNKNKFRTTKATEWWFPNENALLKRNVDAWKWSISWWTWTVVWNAVVTGRSPWISVNWGGAAMKKLTAGDDRAMLELVCWLLRSVQSVTWTWCLWYSGDESNNVTRRVEKKRKVQVVVCDDRQQERRRYKMLENGARSVRPGAGDVHGKCRGNEFCPITSKKFEDMILP